MVALVMKTHAFTCWRVVWTTLFMAVVLRVSADPVPGATSQDRTYTGIVTALNTNEQILHVKRWHWPSKRFVCGKNCAITLLYARLNNGVGTAANLRPGEKVTIGYRVVHGERIADRIDQQPMQLTGTVKKINPEKRLLTVHLSRSNKRLTMAPNCIITLHNGNPGTLTDVHQGDHVVITYEIPDDVPVVWQITNKDP